MSALGKRLGLLRSQAGTVLPSVTPTPPLPSTVPRAQWPRADGARSPEQVVEQLRKLMKLRAPTPAMRPPAPVDRALPGDEIAPGLRYFEQTAAWPYDDDELALGDIRHEPAKRAHLLAFDTETTGLAGGTGTRAFMIGAADFVEGALRIRQLCITTLGAERAMLKTFSTWLRPETVLVSYNGRSYDRPLLTTRYRLARLRDPLVELRHVDLLHPVRRRYRGVWANCKLATVERELLGVLREDDLPGSEAPAAWLRYLRGGSADTLRRVGLHNAQDLRSLFGLLEAMRDEPVHDTVVVRDAQADADGDCGID